MAITKFFLQKRIFTFIMIFLVIVAGVQSYKSLHIETMPQVSAPVMFVAVPLPGAAPEEVESMIVNPLEQKLGEMEGIDKMSSSCWENVGLTVIFFNDTVDPKKAFEQFREKVNEVRPQLPAEIMEPITELVSFENLPMMFLGIRGGDTRTQDELSREADDLKVKIEKIAGVKSVLVTGASAKRVEVDIDQEKLSQFDPSLLRTLTDKLGQVNTNVPGGKITTGLISPDGKDHEYIVRTIGRFSSIEDLNNMVLGTVDGKPVAIKDVGEAVGPIYPEPDVKVRVMGQRGVTLGVLKKKGYGTLDVAAKVNELISSKDYKNDIVVLNDQSASVKRDMGALGKHSLYGTVLVLIVLFLFLGFRVAVIVSTALPLSILLTFMAMSFKGMTIDMVSLFALLLALGLMVDNAIVVCENIYRHMSLGQKPDDAALEATDEVGWPILSSTLCTLAAFLPMLLVGGPIGQFTRPIPWIVTFALVSSYVVALCFNPLLSSTFIRTAEKRKPGSGKWKVQVRRGYNSILNWALDHRGIVIIIAIAIFAGSLGLIKFVGVELFPQTDTSKLYIDIKTPTGATLPETQKVVASVEDVLKKSGTVDRYISTTGSTGMRVEIDDQVFFGSDRARLLIDLKEAGAVGQPAKVTVQKLREAVGKVVPKGTEVHFMEKVLGPPVGPPVNIKISGQDLDKMREARDKIEAQLKDMQLLDIKDNLPGLVPQILIKVNQPVAMENGLTTRDIGGPVFLSLVGYKIGDLNLMTRDEKTNIESEQQVPIFLKIKSSAMTNPMATMNSEIKLPGGKKVTFGDLASFDPTAQGYSAVEHENSQRTVTITAGLPKGLLATQVIDKLKKSKGNIEKAYGVTIDFAGETMLIASAFGDLKKAMLIALLIIYLILLLEFKSTLQPLIILTCVPYALVGVVFGLLVTHNSFGILSFIGVVCLTGIVVNNAIILIDYANLLQSRGVPLRKAIIDAAQTRLRPIIMTKSTVILGVLPLAVTASDKTQFWKPLCWSIIWGLVVATTLTLVIIPVVYHIMENWRSAYYAKRANLKKM